MAKKELGKQFKVTQESMKICIHILMDAKTRKSQGVAFAKGDDPELCMLSTDTPNNFGGPSNQHCGRAKKPKSTNTFLTSGVDMSISQGKDLTKIFPSSSHGDRGREGRGYMPG
jgi:hypothetical protein